MRQASERAHIPDFALVGINPTSEQIGCEFTQWNHHKRSISPPRMRDDQIGFIDRLAIDVHHVDIERAGPPAFDAYPLSGGLK